MPKASSDRDLASLRPLADRLADSRRAEFGPDEAPPADAHPKIVEIVQHWRSLRPAPALLPGRQHFDPILVPGLLNNIWLVDVVRDDPRMFRVRLVGGALVEVGARIRKGTYFEDVAPAEEAAVTTSAFRRLLENKRIDWRRGPSSLRHMEHVRELERVILPLAADGQTVDMFLCLTVLYLANGSVL